MIGLLIPVIRVLNPHLVARFTRTNENWRTICERVAKLSSSNEQSLFDLLEEGALVPSGQILRGAGQMGSVLFSSYVLAPQVDESLESLASRITSWTKLGIGCGVNVSPLLNAEDHLSLDRVVNAIGGSQQSLWDLGIRRTATMLVVDYEVRRVSEVARRLAIEPHLRHLNLAVNLSDDVMRAAQEAHSEERAVLENLLRSALNTGNPGFVFIDRVNLDCEGEEPLRACNACAEQHLHPNEGVPLASINLAGFVHGRALDFDALKEVVSVAVRFLDDIIDVTAFPSSETQTVARSLRRIGVGVMGLDTALRLLELPYDSDDGISASEQIAAAVAQAAQAETRALATHRGVPQGLIDTATNSRRRNSGVLCVAPTGGISSLWGVSSGIEPTFGSMLQKEELRIRVNVGNKSMRLPDPHEIHWSKHLRHLTAWQRFVDGGISKTVNLPEHSSVPGTLPLLFDAWGGGAKSLSMFRTGSRAGGVTSV